MSVSPHPRPTHPFFRKVACLTIGVGSLLMAGTVLSSVVRAPVHPSQTYAPPAFEARPIYALPVRPAAGGAYRQPMVAMVHFRHGFLHITNASSIPWRNVRLGGQGVPPSVTPLLICPVLLPQQTCVMPVRREDLDPRLSQSGHQAPSVSWECHTPGGTSRWQGSLMR